MSSLCRASLTLSVALTCSCAGTIEPPRSNADVDPTMADPEVDAQVAEAVQEDAGTRLAAPPEAGLDAGALDAGRPAVAAPPPAPMPASRRSAGCGRGGAGGGGFERRQRRIDDRDRSYHVRVPDRYDESRAYPVVFRWHGSGGNGLSGGLSIEEAAPADMFVVAADGINSTWSGGSEANDLQLFDAMLAEISEQYCIDRARIFAYGFSAGGGFSNLLGCKRADVLRAVAPLASFDRADASCDGRPMAAWFMHDRDDGAVRIDIGRAARDRNLRRNGCANEGTQNGECTYYRGCRVDQPVVWCESGGLGHDIRGDFAPRRVWEFFEGLH